jgi:hypothetical protein
MIFGKAGLLILMNNEWIKGRGGEKRYEEPA